MVWTVSSEDDIEEWKNNILIKFWRENFMNTRKLTINAILLAVWALLHQITPAIGLPMQPDFSLVMLFIIMLINKDDYKTSIISAIITGVFTALTTKFPGGQIPNVIDKIVTANVVYLIIFGINKIKLINNLSEKKRKSIVLALVFPIGTLISGTIFLLAAQFIVGLPAPFIALFLTVVLPATAINLIAGLFLYKVVEISMKRIAYAR